MRSYKSYRLMNLRWLMTIPFYLCVSANVHTHQLLNQSAFSRNILWILCQWSTPQIVILNFPLPVIITWQTCQFLRAGSTLAKFTSVSDRMFGNRSWKVTQVFITGCFHQESTNNMAALRRYYFWTWTRWRHFTAVNITGMAGNRLCTCLNINAHIKGCF